MDINTPHTERSKIQMPYNKYEIMEAKINKNLEGDQIILKKIGLKKPSIHEILSQMLKRLDKQDEFNSQVLKRLDTLDNKLERNNIRLDKLESR